VGHSIMVVDDDPDTLYLFETILRTNGYNVIGFLDPIPAFEYIQVYHEEYSLVLTDYRMPKMTGCEFVNKIEELDNKIRIIIITALNTVNNSLKVPIIFKPITMRELVDLIKDNIIF
jgi:DNA-binding NtrC family response regulator